MPPRPMVAVSTVAPLCMTATSDTMPVCGKYTCSISSPTSCSITPRSSGIVRRCGASKEKSCGGNAAKNRLNCPCSNCRAIGDVPYGIGVGSCFKAATPRHARQAEIAFTDSALRSAYRSAGSLDQWSYVKKVPQWAAAHEHSTPRRAAGPDGDERGAPAWLRRGGLRKPGERNHAAGANPYACAGQTYRRKLVLQLSIVFEQLCGAFPDHRYLLNKHRRSAGRSNALPDGGRRGRPDRPQFDLSGARRRGVRRHDLEGRMAYGHAQDFAPFVHHLQEPARPAPRIAGNLGIGEVADDRQRLLARGRPVRQFDAFVVRHSAIAEAQMEEVERHDPSPV